MMVSNHFPTRTSTRRIALVGEAPGEQECEAGLPFVGPSGQLLNKFLAQAGIDREVCFIGNVTQHRPPGNDITRFKWEGEQIQSGLKQLAEDLRRFQPHFIICLGGTALRAFMGGKPGIDNWRGSLFRAVEVMPGVKCMATYHPARVMRDYGLTGVVKFDMAKAAAETRTDELIIPEDTLEISLTKDELVARLRDLVENPHPVAVDIEGYPDRITCIGFADSSNHAFVVPIIRSNWERCWSEEDEVELVEWVGHVLEDSRIKKRCHNAAYELFCLAWTWGIVIEGLEHDSMVLWFELYCEMEKSLAFVTSVLTKHPYYKGERLAEDDATQLRYNGKDCCRTYEVCERMLPMLKPQQRQHYEMNMGLLIPLAYMSLRGMRYDVAEAKRRLDATEQELYELQDAINREAAKSASRPQLKAFYAALDPAYAGGGEAAPRGHQAREDSVVNSDDGSGVGCNGGGSLQAFGLGHRGVEEAVDTPQDCRRDELLQPGAGRAHEVEHGSGRVGSGVRLDALLPLLTAAFCQATRTEQRGVEERRWQPMRLNKKGKWVKAGKLLDDGEAPSLHILKAIQETGLNNQWTEAEAPTTPVSCWLKPCHKVIKRNLPVAVETLEDVQRFAKGSCKADCERAIHLCESLSERGVRAAECGELATLLGIHIKLNATGRGKDIILEDGTRMHGNVRDANWFVYDYCGSPKQYIREGVHTTDRLTSNDSALIHIYIQTKDPRISTFMKWRYLDTRTETLKIKADSDGRIRCSYNLVGTETARLSCSKSSTGSGYNLQTTTDDLRDLILADEGCEFGQFDETGADGYTIAANCMRFGDDTMMRDLQAGVKPVNIIVLLYTEGAHINQLPREELLVAQKRVSKTSWQYAATKPILYGTAYLMGAKRMAAGIAEDSFKDTGEPVVISVAQCEQIMTRIDLRYPGIKRWQEDAGCRMIAEGLLHSSVGFVRRFFGRKSNKKKVRGVWHQTPDRQTLGEWLGHEPQYYTTLGMKLALKRLWKDPENRREDGSLRIEPLHTVHDSLNPQWRVEDREFAKRKVLPEYFDNSMLIAGQKLVIPASGTCGPNWKDQEKL